MTSRSVRRLGALAALVALTTAGCAGSGSGGDEGGEADDTIATQLTPSAAPGATDTTPTPDTTTAPAPSPSADGPPRVVDTVASGLEAPWGLDFLPDGDAVVTERDSERVLIISGPEHTVNPVGTVELASPGGEGGLLGVAVSPDFAADSLLYFYATTDVDNRVVRATLTPDGLGPVEDVFTGIPNGAIHDGGRLEFGPDGDLYVSTGEGGQSDRSQDRQNLGGKILRITTDGEAAADNPFGNAVFSYGHRNVQGLAFTDDGRLWASEFGQDTFDELNAIEAGSDYGWPDVEGKGGTEATDRGFVDPVRQWSTDEASPSGLAYADGSLWMGALRGSRLWRIPVADGVTGEPKGYFVGDYGRMRTVALAPDGTLWVTTSNRDGRGDPTEDDDRILAIQP